MILYIMQRYIKNYTRYLGQNMSFLSLFTVAPTPIIEPPSSCNIISGCPWSSMPSESPTTNRSSMNDDAYFSGFTDCASPITHASTSGCTAFLNSGVWQSFRVWLLKWIGSLPLLSDSSGNWVSSNYGMQFCGVCWEGIRPKISLRLILTNTGKLNNDDSGFSGITAPPLVNTGIRWWGLGGLRRILEGFTKTPHDAASDQKSASMSMSILLKNTNTNGRAQSLRI